MATATIEKVDLGLVVSKLQKDYPSLKPSYFGNEDNICAYSDVYLNDSELKEMVGALYLTRQSRSSDVDFFAAIGYRHDGRVYRVSQTFYFGLTGHQEVMEIAALFARDISFIVRYYDTFGRVLVREGRNLVAIPNPTYGGSYDTRKPLYSHSIVRSAHASFKTKKAVEDAILKNVDLWIKYVKRISSLN